MDTGAADPTGAERPEPFPDPAQIGSIAERLVRVADGHADSPALRSPAGSWTYSELVDSVSRLAGRVQELVGSPDPAPVALLADHDGPLVVAILAVIHAGHIVVVLDPAAPEDQVAGVLAESSATVLLADEPHRTQAQALADGAPGEVAVADIADTGDRPVEVAQRGPQDPCMLAFTSGTSGAPKGAVITHGLILNVVRGATEALDVTDRDRMPMLFPTSLAVAAYPLFIPLLNGGTLATLDVRGVGLAPIGPFLEEERITLAYLAPTVVRFLVDALEGRSFPDLRLVALGGEAVDAEAVELTRRLLDVDVVANGFGTTETGVITLHVVPPGEVPDGPVPSGLPVPDVELMVLDDAGEPVQPGGSGEIAVSSPYVFSGYWGREDLTRTVLSPDPKGRPGWHLYRTGDLGRLDADGRLVVMGRVDTKVKVRGRFVVLGDVEALLHGRDEIADAVVVPRTRDGVTELVAVVVPAAGGDFDGPALRGSLLEGAEAHQVPSAWVTVEELPRLPNGKVDRRAAAELAQAGPVEPVDGGGPAPATAPSRDGDLLARQLRDLWEELLPGVVVGPDDDFFHLGGDSLLAAQMLVLAEQRTGITVPMGELIFARTVRTLADRMAELRDASSPPTTATVVQPGDPRRPRLWFVHDLQGSAYRVRHVARELGADQPVWSFESPLLRGEPNRFRNLDDMARLYVEDLRRAQPEGPYWVAGYSFGGICAYEMARQLAAQGEDVAFVGVVDVGPGYRGEGWHSRRSPFRPWFGVAKPPPEGATLPEQARHYTGMLRSSPAAFARHLMVRSGLSRLVDPLRFRRDLRQHGRVRPEWRLWYAWEEHWRLATKAWDRSSTYAGRVDLFWADATASADATMGWQDLVGDLRIHRFTGDHIGILEERGAANLAKVLRDVLDEVRSSRSD